MSLVGSVGVVFSWRKLSFAECELARLGQGNSTEAAQHFKELRAHIDSANKRTDLSIKNLSDRLGELKADLQDQSNALRADLQGQSNALRADLLGQSNALKADLKADLLAEMRAQEGRAEFRLTGPRAGLPKDMENRQVSCLRAAAAMRSSLLASKCK